MSAAALLADLKARGAMVRLDGEDLELDAPEEVWTDVLLETLRERKAEIITELRARQRQVQPPDLRQLDQAHRFITEARRFLGQVQVHIPTLFDAYRADCLAEGMSPIGFERFAQDFKAAAGAIQPMPRGSQEFLEAVTRGPEGLD